MHMINELHDLLANMYKIASLDISLKFSEYNTPGGSVKLMLQANPGIYTSTKLKALQRVLERIMEWSMPNGVVRFRDEMQKNPASNAMVNTNSDGWMEFWVGAQRDKSVSDILLDSYGNMLDLSSVSIEFTPNYDSMYYVFQKFGQAYRDGESLPGAVEKK